jgi:hypothetical protein
MAWTREQATATIGHAHHMQSSFIPARLEWATIGCMGVRSPIAFFAAPKQGGRRTRKHDVGWETTRLGQKKDFMSPDTYFFLFLLYSNICINEFYKLRWEKDPLCPPPWICQTTQAGLHMRKQSQGCWCMWCEPENFLFLTQL